MFAEEILASKKPIEETKKPFIVPDKVEKEYKEEINYLIKPKKNPTITIAIPIFIALAKAPIFMGKEMKARKVVEIGKSYYWKKLPAVPKNQIP